MSKTIKIENFNDHIFDGMSIMVGGFMGVGTPEFLIDEIVKLGTKDITIICNDAGLVNRGVGKLILNGQVKKLIASHIGLNPEAGRLMSEGKMECELVPQGTLAEQIRAGGAGLGGVLTPTGIGTMVENDKKIISLEGKKYIVEPAMKADLALIYGSLVDKYGNTQYSKTTRNFNPVMATATKHVIVLARKLVEEMNPDQVLTPHIFIDNIIEEAQNG